MAIAIQNITHGFPPLSPGPLNWVSPSVAVAAMRAEQLFRGLTPIAPNIFLNQTSPQCFAIHALEENVKNSMRQAREGLLVPPQEARFGEKHRNLMQMDHVVRSLQLGNLEIPLPKGIASDDVISFLQKRAPEVFEHWKSLQASYAAYQGNASFLQTQEVRDRLLLLEQAIERAFSVANLSELGFPLQWLQEREKAKEFLMVRSTGAEDGKIANAGGNVSRAYVRPAPKQFLQAVGSVVKSYFGVNSLQNRLNGGGNPFQEPLQLSVTTQPLIGEPVGGTNDPTQIPISFVLFTNEPLYIGEEKFRVMRISASFGHGEGVVSGQGIGTDTILLLRSEAHPDQLYPIYDNQVKRERLAPVQNGKDVTLRKVPNPNFIQTRPALDEKLLVLIYQSAIVMESFFGGHPTDIEGVVKEGKIYFVQARPVNRKPLLPTFLNDRSKGVISTVQTETIVPGAASVVVVSKKEEVLFANTLQEAENTFHAKGKEGYKLVIVSHPEPQNSHPVVNFSSLGVPCLYAADPEAVKQVLDQINSDHPLAACIQTATLNLWDLQKEKLQDAIQEGFAVHPAKIAVSLPVASLISSRKEAIEPLKELLLQLRKSTSLKEAKPVIGEIKKRINGLQQEIGRYERSFQALSLIPKEALVRLDLLKELHGNLERTVEEVEAVLKNHPGRLQRLFHIKVLETLLTQSNAKTAVGQYSLLNVKNQIQSLDLLIDYQKKFSFPVQFADLLLAGEKAANPEAFLFWRNFLEKIEVLVQSKKISPKEVGLFRSLVLILQETEALPSWITFLSEKNVNAKELFARILIENTPTDLQLIRQLSQMQEFIEQRHSLLETIADPKTHTQGIEEMISLSQKLSSPVWLNQIKNASLTTRSIAYQVMRKGLHFIDESMKSLKTNNQWDAKTKAARFKELLKPYFHMMKSWALQVPTEKIGHHRNWPLTKYLDELEKILQELSSDTPNALMPSREFSVAAAILSAGTEFERHRPQTLEDTLTLLHQNALSWISILNQEPFSQSRIEQSMIPFSLKNAMKELETNNFGIRVQKIGMDIKEEEIIFHYNIPLSNHSGRVDLLYDIRSGRLTLRARLLGRAGMRWPRIAAWEQLLESGAIYSPACPIHVGEQELTFCWDVSSGNLRSAIEEYASMANYATYDDIFDSTFDQLAKGLKRDTSNPLSRALRAGSMNRSTSWLIEQLFANLLHRGKMHDFLSFAQETFQSSDDKTRVAALGLFGQLVINGQGYDMAIQAAQEAFQSTNRDIRYEALQLLQELVRSGQAYDVAIQAAQEAFQNTDKNIRYATLRLLQELVRNNQAYDMAMQAAREAFQSTDVEIGENALELFKELIEKGQAYDVATQTAREALQSTDEEVRYNIPRLLQELVRSGQAYDVAIQAARRVLRSTNEAILLDTLNLLRKLVEKGQAYDVAIQTAQKALQGTDESSRWVTFLLLEDLAEKGQAYDVAAEAAAKAFQSENNAIRRDATDLFRTLFTKGQAYDVAAKVAAEGFQKDSSHFCLDAKTLFQELFKYDKAYDIAVRVAKQVSKSGDRGCRACADELLRDLLTKGKA